MKGREWGTLGFELALGFAAVGALLLWYGAQSTTTDCRRRVVALERERATRTAAFRTLQEELVLHRRAMRRSVLREDARLLIGQGLTGSERTFKVGDGKQSTILFSIDPDCPACEAMLPFVDSISQRSECPAQVIGLVIEEGHDMAGFVARHSIEYPVLREASGALWDFLPLGRSPVVAVVSRNGAVRGWWTGVLPEGERRAVRDAVDSCD